MNITNKTPQVELRKYYKLEKSKVNLWIANLIEVPTGFTGRVGFKYSNNIYHINNFNRKKILHRLDGPAVIGTIIGAYNLIVLKYFVLDQELYEEEFQPIYEAYKTNDEELLNNTIGMVLAAKEYAKKESK